MRIIDTSKIEETVYDLALSACVSVTPECEEKMRTAESVENNPLSLFALKNMNENFNVANKTGLPVCQDTGIACVMLSIGQDVYFTGKLLSDAIYDGVKRAYSDGAFRKSVLDPITRENTGDNTPAMIYTEIVSGDKVTVEFLPKGFGSENMSKIYMLTPADGVDGVIDKIVETVKNSGSKPCPPVYVGVGIGGTFDKCAYLAKKALTRPIGSKNPREDVSKIEEEALKRINELNIGAQGFGGKTTALGVSVEVMPTHIAGLPVAVNIQCHCVRAKKAVI